MLCSASDMSHESAAQQSVPVLRLTLIDYESNSIFSEWLFACLRWLSAVIMSLGPLVLPWPMFVCDKRQNVSAVLVRSGALWNPIRAILGQIEHSWAEETNNMHFNPDFLRIRALSRVPTAQPDIPFVNRQWFLLLPEFSLLLSFISSEHE